jgi:hypothetical protein
MKKCFDPATLGGEPEQFGEAELAEDGAHVVFSCQVEGPGWYWWGPYFAGEQDGPSTGGGVAFMTSPEGPSGNEPEGEFLGSGPHGPYLTEAAAIAAWKKSVRTYGRS